MWLPYDICQWCNHKGSQLPLIIPTVILGGACLLCPAPGTAGVKLPMLPLSVVRQHHCQKMKFFVFPFLLVDFQKHFVTALNRAVKYLHKDVIAFLLAQSTQEILSLVSRHLGSFRLNHCNISGMVGAMKNTVISSESSLCALLNTISKDLRKLHAKNGKTKVCIF